MNMNCIEEVNKGDWAVLKKINLLVAGGVPSQLTAAPSGPPLPPGAGGPGQKAVPSAPGAASSSGGPPLPPPPGKAKGKPPSELHLLGQPQAKPKPSVSRAPPTKRTGPPSKRLPKSIHEPVASGVNTDAQEAAVDGFYEIEGFFESFEEHGLALEIDYPKFIHTPEFKAEYGAYYYPCLGVDLVPTMDSLQMSLRQLEGDVETKFYFKAIKRVVLTLDVHSKAAKDPALQLDPQTKTLTVTYSFQTFSHDRNYNYYPRIKPLLQVLRSEVDQLVIADLNKKIAAHTDALRAASKQSGISVSFDWKELLADPECRENISYIHFFLNIVPDRIEAAFLTKSSDEYDQGLIEYIQKYQLSLAGVTEIVFHMATSSKFSSEGKLGLFTPHKYLVIKQGSKLDVTFPRALYELGAGAAFEWVLDQSKAQARQNKMIDKLAQRNYEEELTNRAKKVSDTQADNAKRARYEQDLAEYKTALMIWNSAPATKTCPGCRGNGRFGGSDRATAECAQLYCNGRGVVPNDPGPQPQVPQKLPQLPIPTFPACRVEDFKTGLKRSELRGKTL